MIRIIFKGLDESVLAKEAVLNHLESAQLRFPELERHKVDVTLSMDRSQGDLGPDLFKVKLAVSGKKYKGLTFEKSAMSLYSALSEVSNHMLERLPR